MTKNDNQIPNIGIINKSDYFKIPYLNTVVHEWGYKEFSRESLKEFTESNIKIPGTYGFDSKVENFYTEASIFKERGNYCTKPKGSKDYRVYWDRQKEFILNSVIIDDWLLQGDHYFYLNFLPINIKATQAGEFNVLTFPDFRDLDFRAFNKTSFNELRYLHSVWLKSRQTGFEQPNSALIATRDGFSKLGDLKVGDFIFTQDGTETKVTDIFEHPNSEVYEVEFLDGRKVKCGLEHLWEVFDRKDNKWKTLQTKDLIGNLNSTPVTTNGKVYETSRFYIPENKCLNYTKKQLEVHPYVLGCLIGDGSLRPQGQIQLTTMDEEMLETILSILGEDYYLTKEPRKEYSQAARYTFRNKNTYNTEHNVSNYGNESNVKFGYNPLGRAIEKLGLKGKTTYDKFIPEQYLLSSKEDRIELLQGLMDTDGYINAIGSDLNFTTVNEQLSVDVARLCRSLGITVNVDKKPAVKKSHKDFYRVRLSGVINFPLFKLHRKLDRQNIRDTKRQGLKRFRYCNITKITKLDYREDSRCISVEHPSQLYLTNDFVVTHNTLKKVVPLVKKVWFEDNKICKLITPEERFVKKTWSDIIEPYRNHLNKHTAWYRAFSPDKTLDWKQQVEINEGGKKSYIGTGSTLLGFTTKGSPTSPVSGLSSHALLDECGLEKNLLKILQYLTPSLKAGKYVTGFVECVGAVGELKDAEDLKELFYNPSAHGFAANINIFDNNGAEIGEFIPANWALEGFIDEWGNANPEKAKEFLLSERESKRKLSARDYQIYISQYPLTPTEAFSSREDNPFPKEIIQPHFEYLEREYTPLEVTLEEEKGKVYHKLGSKSPAVVDFPVTNSTDKRGAVILHEPPLYDDIPLGLYYSACDPVTEIKTSTSESLQCLYIYRADHYQNGNLIQGALVAEYTGRHDNVAESWEICRRLIHYYNARCMIESNKEGFIKWLIQKKETLYLMKRSEYPRLQEIMPNSKVNEEYGIRKTTSTAFLEHLLSSAIRYVTEEIGTTFDKEGNSKPIYGVTRIKDKMLLKEMLNYSSRANLDRLWTFCYVINVAEGNTIRHHLQRVEEDRKIVPIKGISQFNNNYLNKANPYKIRQF